jgi:hypothetical protein
MKILTRTLLFGLIPVFLMSCTPQQESPPSREIPSLARVDLPHKSLPSERINVYGRQSGKDSRTPYIKR